MKIAHMMINIDNGNLKDIGMCFPVDFIDWIYFGCELYIHTSLERASIDSVNILNLNEEQEIESCLKELDIFK